MQLYPLLTYTPQGDELITSGLDRCVPEETYALPIEQEDGLAQIFLCRFRRGMKFLEFAGIRASNVVKVCHRNSNDCNERLNVYGEIDPIKNLE